MSPLPYAYAYVERGQGCWRLRIPCCPFCGRAHSHGGGPLAADPAQFFSGRVAHCVGSRSRGYVLTSVRALQRRPVPQWKAA